MEYTIFGESHGPAVGVTVTGLPSGLAVDLGEMDRQLARRAGGRSPLTTARKEPDRVEFLSGLYLGKTTGTPLTLVIRNEDRRSGDYDAQVRLPRPSHGDYTGVLRYGGCADPRGGGHFSGRLTAPLVAVGALARQLLAERGVCVGARIAAVAGVEDAPLDLAQVDPALLARLGGQDFPVLDPALGAAMREKIRAAREEGDSVGGLIQGFVCGLPGGLGAPDLDQNAEGIFARHLFAVPAVRGLEFGDGFALSALRGSQANDPFYVENGAVRTKTNHSGGINGGITNGMPLSFTAAMRPTPSIALEQETVDLAKGTGATVSTGGRHDPCIVPRAVPVIEAAAALAACQLLGI